MTKTQSPKSFVQLKTHKKVQNHGPTNESQEQMLPKSFIQLKTHKIK